MIKKFNILFIKLFSFFCRTEFFLINYLNLKNFLKIKH